MTRRRALPIAAIHVLLLTIAMVSLAGAAPITSITALNNFRDTRGLNDVGIGSGDLIQFGADVVPNGTAGTTMRAAQGTTVLGPILCIPLAVSPNFCGRTVAFSDALRGAWTLTFENGGNSAMAATPDLSLLPPQTSPPQPSAPVPFPVSVTITGTGLQPTITFAVPDGFAPSAIRFQIFDKDDRLANGQANVIHTVGTAGTVRSFTVPPVLSSGRLLRLGGNYALNIQLIDTRNDDVPFTNSNAQILRRSSSFFSFTPRNDGEQAAFLPTVGPDGVYRFHIAGILPGAVVFIDPLVAVGYDYAKGAADPNFESVILPDVGDGAFTLRYVFQGAVVEERVLAGQRYFFPAGGVGAFSVRGIETSARLDPASVTAFVTGLTFVQAGSFTGTMTPTTQNVADDQFTVIGLEGIDVGEYATVAGTLASNGGVAIGKAARIAGGVAADAVALGEWARVEGSVVATTIAVGQNAAITGSQSNDIDLPVAGPLLLVAGTPGVEPVVVPKQGVRALSAGSFLSIVAGESAEIRFAGGQYDVAELRVGRGARLVFEGAAILNVSSRLELGTDVVLGGEGGLGAAAVVLNYAGSAPAILGKGTRSACAIVAPNAAIYLGEGVAHAGAIWGKWVGIGKAAQVTAGE